MSSIVVHLKNGAVLRFEHEGRAGGSYTKTVRYEGSFAIIEDEWGKRTAIPAENIEKLVETPERYSW